MKKQLLGTIALAALIAGPAIAADIAPPAPIYVPPAPILVAVFSWTGCYVGSNFGGGWNKSNYTTTLDPGTHIVNPANLAAVAAGGTGTANNNSRFLGGGQIGCNWQRGSFVIGLEADIDAFSANPSLTGTGVFTTGDTFVITNAVKTNWLATVRPRVGVAFDRSLLYVTGGLAVTNISYTQTYADTFLAAVGASSASSTKTGWTVGGGWEYGFTNNWSAKVEYLYAKFSSLSALGAVTDLIAERNVLHGSADLRENIVRIGINYRP
jgi:outer membrane immunogenic protein